MSTSLLLKLHPKAGLPFFTLFIPIPISENSTIHVERNSEPASMQTGNHITRPCVCLIAPPREMAHQTMRHFLHHPTSSHLAGSAPTITTVSEVYLEKADEEIVIDTPQLKALQVKLEEIGIKCGSFGPGQNNGLMCPMCQGGDSGEKKLSSFLKMVMLYGLVFEPNVDGKAVHGLQLHLLIDEKENLLAANTEIIIRTFCRKVILRRYYRLDDIDGASDIIYSSHQIDFIM